MKNILLVGLLMVCLVGCTISVKKDAVHVIATVERSDVEKYKFLGEVKAWSGWSGVAVNAGKKSCLNQLKNKAHKLGGDYVLIVHSGIKMGGVSMIGAVYNSKEKGEVE